MGLHSRLSEEFEVLLATAVSFQIHHQVHAANVLRGLLTFLALVRRRQQARQAALDVDRVQSYLQSRLHERLALDDLVAATSEQLQQLYARQDTMDKSTLQARKAQLLDELARDYANLAGQYEEPGPFGPPPVRLNNAQLVLFRQYNQHVPAFRQMLKELNYRFSEFYRAVEELSRQPADSRTAQLELLSKRFVEHL